jgi:hypothetical protein
VEGGRWNLRIPRELRHGSVKTLLRAFPEARETNRKHEATHQIIVSKVYSATSRGIHVSYHSAPGCVGKTVSLYRLLYHDAPRTKYDYFARNGKGSG